jgi:hypothetical protein
MGVPDAAPVASLLDTPVDWREAQRGFWRDWSPRILAISACGFAIWRAVLGPFGWTDALAPLAVAILWPLQEWLVHAHVLHFEPRRFGPFTLDLHVAKQHRAHHADPWNGPLSFVPKRTFLHVAVALAIARLIAGPVAPWVATTLAVYAALALRYEWSHYLAHIRYSPRWAETNKRHHRIHHFQSPDTHWGVSTTAADRILQTA